MVNATDFCKYYLKNRLLWLLSISIIIFVGVSLPKNWTIYTPKINEKKQLILGYENK